jgi:transcriptional regulator with XRE-family HTH domain
MDFLHEELRRAREKAGLSQQALAELAGIPRNQVVRAERGQNITVDTLRKIAAHLPVTELTLLETRSLRVDIVAEPEKLFLAALENVVRLTETLESAIQLAMQARVAVEVARRAGPLLPSVEESEAMDPVLLLRTFQRIADEIRAISKETKIAS